MGWGSMHAPAGIPPGKRPGTLCTGGWVDISAGLEKIEYLIPQRNSILGLSGP